MEFTKAERELIDDIKGHLQSGNIDWERFMDIAQYALATVDDGDEWDEEGYEDDERPTPSNSFLAQLTNHVIFVSSEDIGKDKKEEE